MREILFRGKRADNDEWIEGFLSKSRNTEEKPALLKLCIDYEENGVMMSCIINSKTVGQFTGLTDKNGKKIFEGDILRHDKGDLHEVVFEQRNGHAYFGWTINELETWDFDLDFLRLLEIVGNIHDNRDLLYTVDPSTK